jgi:hypothetical protein
MRVFSVKAHQRWHNFWNYVMDRFALFMLVWMTILLGALIGLVALFSWIEPNEDTILYFEGGNRIVCDDAQMFDSGWVECDDVGYSPEDVVRWEDVPEEAD